MENGKPLSYQFNGGYCSLKDNVTFYFYNQDHLGNNRTVINSTTGKAEQTINYYPFGTPYCDSTSVNPGFQKFKYNGKELDMMHGLNTYDYGARQYYSVVPAWDRIDPLCEKYYSISPYAYCGNNPVNLTDPDGKDPVTGAIIGGAIELGSQLIEKYDVNESVWTNLSQNVNWTGVAIATGEGALTSGVSALKGIGAKMVISAVSSGMKEVSEQVHNGEDVNYVTVAVQSLAGAASTYGVGRYANNKTDIKFKNVKAKPTDKAVMHKRAGQMRYTKSTRRNARNRLRAQKEKNTNKEEAKANAFISVIKALFNRCLSSSL